MDEYVPKYKATFWVGNWFPEDIGWVGVPNFEEAYMYIDWVRIKQYGDPWEEGGKGSNSQSTATNLGNSPIPLNNYIADGRFRQEGSDTPLAAWTVNSGSLTRNGSGTTYVTLAAASKLYQYVSAQYTGYSFTLSADAEVLTGGGKCKVYAEYMIGSVKMGQSNAVEFDLSEGERQKNIEFTVTPAKVTDLRIVVETEAGTTAKIYEIKMNMA
jgi:hypothetical protein